MMEFIIGGLAGTLIGTGLVCLVPAYIVDRWEFPRPLVITGLSAIAAGALLLFVSIVF